MSHIIPADASPTTRKNMELIQKAQSGDKEARDEFVRRNYNLILYAVSKHLGFGYEFDELKGVASIAFLRAIDTFDTNRGVSFSTYAYKVMQNDIIRYHRKNKKHFDVLYLDSQVVSDKEIEDTTFIDLLEDKTAMEKYDQIENLDLITKVVEEFKKVATPRELDYFQWRFIEGKTQSEIAEEAKKTRQWASFLEQNIIKKLQKIAKRKFPELVGDSTVHITLKEKQEMTRETLRRRLKWFFENTQLTDREIAKILGSTQTTTKKYRNLHNIGQFNVPADESARKLYEKYIKKKEEEDEARKASPVVVTKIESIKDDPSQTSELKTTENEIIKTEPNTGGLKDIVIMVSGIGYENIRALIDVTVSKINKNNLYDFEIWIKEHKDPIKED